MKKPKSTTEVGATVFGYRDGLYQYSRAVRLLVSKPQNFFLEDAKRYINETLEVAETNIFTVKKAPGVELDPSIESVVGLISAVARHALQSGSFPAYEDVLAVSTQPASASGSKTSVVLLVPTVSRLGPKFIRNAFDFASSVAMEFTLPKYKRKQITTLTDTNLERVVELTRVQAKGGYSLRFLLQQAFEMGVPLTHLGSGHYQFGFGSKSKVFLRSATQNDSMIGAKLTFDKLECIARMKVAGIPVPLSRPVRDAKTAKLVAEQTGFPVVIKPSDLDRGEGVTVDVQNGPEVVRAFERAKKLSNSILLENRVPGICHRLLVFKDRLVFAYARHPLSAVGDGTSTIRELVGKMQQAEAVKAAHLRKKTCSLDELAVDQLKLQNYDPDTVLEPNQIAYLRPYEGEVWGGYDEYLTEKVHPANTDLARRAARLFGLEVAGIDIISEDISRPWYETGAVINEVNFRPQVAQNTARAFMELSFPDGDAQVHVECFIGDSQAMSAAKARRRELARQSSGVFLTSHELSIDDDGNTIFLSNAEGVFRRSEILLQDNRLSTLVVVVQTDEMAATGLPFSKVASVQEINRKLLSHKDAGAEADQNSIDRLIGQLRMYHPKTTEPLQKIVS